MLWRAFGREERGFGLTGTFDLHGGEAGAHSQVGGMQAQQQPQVPLCVNQRGGQAAQVRRSHGLLVGLEKRQGQGGGQVTLVDR